MVGVEETGVDATVGLSGLVGEVACPSMSDGASSRTRAGFYILCEGDMTPRPWVPCAVTRWMHWWCGMVDNDVRVFELYLGCILTATFEYALFPSQYRYTRSQVVISSLKRKITHQ